MATTSSRGRRNSSRGKLILFLVEILIIGAMGLVLWLVTREPEQGGAAEPYIGELNEEELKIPSEVLVQKEAGGTMHGYLNVALFGLDLTDTTTTNAAGEVVFKEYTDDQLKKNLLAGNRSDSIMVASINLENGDIKLLSVYRDTYLNLGVVNINGRSTEEDYYAKCNAAYAYGGPQGAVKMLNMNLDMDITKYIAVNYRALVDAIDGLGGILIDVDKDELRYINDYQSAIAANLGRKWVPVKDTGYQVLDGLQATAYCRIRQTAGDDFKRAERQREVLKAIEAQAKQTDLVTLTNVFNNCIGYVLTNVDSKDILDLLGNITKYRIVAEDGFPQKNMLKNGNIGTKGACVIPGDLENGVEWLHKFFFDDEDYVVTDSVRAYSRQIVTDTEKYPLH